MKVNERDARIIIIVTAVVAFLLLLTLVFQFIKINNLKTLESNLAHSQSQLQKEIDDYNSEINNILDREKNLGDYAHKYLNWTKNGETWYTSR